MLIKLYFLICIFHQIIKIECFNYAEVEKFGSSIIEEPDTSGKIFFYLKINDYSKNSNIYIKFTSEEKENLVFYYGFVSIINPYTQSISSFEKISPKVFKDEDDDRTFYFSMKKKSNNNFLAFYIESKGAFTSRIIFENTEKDESKKVIKDIIIAIICIVIGIGVITLIVILICKCCKPKDHSKEILQQYQNQQINNQNIEIKNQKQNPQMKYSNEIGYMMHQNEKDIMNENKYNN